MDIFWKIIEIGAWISLAFYAVGMFVILPLNWIYDTFKPTVKWLLKIK